MKSEDVSFTVSIPVDWEPLKLNFDYAAYLVTLDGHELDGLPHKEHTAKDTRLKVPADVFKKYVEPLIKRYGSRVLAVNAVLQFLSQRPDLNQHQINLPG